MVIINLCQRLKILSIDHLPKQFLLAPVTGTICPCLCFNIILSSQLILFIFQQAVGKLYSPLKYSPPYLAVWR